MLSLKKSNRKRGTLLLCDILFDCTCIKTWCLYQTVSKTLTSKFKMCEKKYSDKIIVYSILVIKMYT